MQTTVRALNSVDYVLDLHVPKEELEPRIQDVLKKQRKSVNLKGFRPGMVPMSIMNKMFGPAVAVQVVEQLIGEVFKEEITDKEAHQVLGQPRLTTFDYEPGTDLTAAIAFGVRPDLGVASLEGVEVTKFTKEITAADIDADIERRRDLKATEADAPEGTAASSADSVKADFQLIDKETGAPVAGRRYANQTVPLFGETTRPELRDALLGAKVGDTVTIDLAHQHAEGEGLDHDDHIDRFEVTVTGVLLRTLPALDADFFRAETNGEAEDEDGFRVFVRKALETSWERRSTDALHEAMVRKLIALHPFEVPATVVDAVIDGMIEDLKRRIGGELPETFDYAGFRDERRAQATEQARWFLLKDHYITSENLALTDADWDEEFKRFGGEDVDPAGMRRFFQQYPEMLDQMGERLLNDRLFGLLAQRFTVVEKSRADFQVIDEDDAE